MKGVLYLARTFDTASLPLYVSYSFCPYPDPSLALLLPYGTSGLTRIIFVFGFGGGFGLGGRRGFSGKP